MQVSYLSYLQSVIISIKYIILIQNQVILSGLFSNVYTGTKLGCYCKYSTKTQDNIYSIITIKKMHKSHITVSQICSLICFPSIVIILAPNSTPKKLKTSQRQ